MLYYIGYTIYVILSYVIAIAALFFFGYGIISFLGWR